MDLALHPLFAQNRTIFTHEEELLASLHRRIRDVRQGPDGLLYVLTDAGALLRLEPAP